MATVPRTSNSWFAGQARRCSWLRFAFIPVFMLLLLGMLVWHVPSASAEGSGDSDSKNGTPSAPLSPTVTEYVPSDETEVPGSPTSVPTQEYAPTPTRVPGWEDNALRDLAYALGWPPVVTSDSSGRLFVELSNDEDWANASIRPFAYAAGAEASFIAEMQDARISGYQVITDTFFTYPAYWAVITDTTGSRVESKFHWLASPWVMGVDLHGAPAQSGNARGIAQQLLVLAVEYGLPPPPGGLTPTPVPSASATPTIETCGISFPDVPPDYWAYIYITDLACNHVVSGFGDGKFRPNSPTTRGQLVKMVVLSEGWPLIDPSQPTFVDVPTWNTFYRYIETAYRHDVLSGYADNTFRPDSLVTRAQVAKIVVRAKDWSLTVPSPVNLCDVKSNHWAYAYVQVAISHGLFAGYGDGCFRPDAFATRAQLAKVLSLANK